MTSVDKSLHKLVLSAAGLHPVRKFWSSVDWQDPASELATGESVAQCQPPARVSVTANVECTTANHSMGESNVKARAVMVSPLRVTLAKVWHG